jgi:hypothetical protein
MLPPCKARVHERRDDYSNKRDHANNERLKLLNDLHHDCRVVAFCCICIDPDNARANAMPAEPTHYGARLARNGRAGCAQLSRREPPTHRELPRSRSRQM